MKNRGYIGLAAVIVAAAGCTSETLETDLRGVVTTVLEVSAGGSGADGDAARTGISPSLGGTRRTLWCEGDCLSLDGTASQPLEAQYAGGQSARFVWGVSPSEGHLLYPASCWKDSRTVTLPYGQDKMPGDDDISSGSLPMCGVASGGKASMKHLCAVLRLQWVRNSTVPDSVSVCYVQLRGKNDEQLSGDFTVDYDSATLTGVSDAPESRYVRAYSMKRLGSDTTVCNIALPAGTYPNGFTARLVDKRGYYMDVYTKKSKTLAAGTIVTMPCIRFNPSSVKLNALEPATASELIAIAGEWNTGRYEGGAAHIRLASDIVFTQEQSLEWTGTGGIGTSDAPYCGTFDGNGFSIKGLTSTAPLFCTVGPDGVLKNIVTDSTCVFETAGIAASFSGRMSACSNYAAVSFSTDLSADAVVGGLVKEALDGAVIEDCRNYGEVTVSTEGTSNTAAACLGGIVGLCTGRVTISGCENCGRIYCNYPTTVKVNRRASHLGGIAGHIDGPGSTISLCNDSGPVYNTNWNNSDNLLATVSGGIAGAVTGSAASPVSITDCKVLGPGLMQNQRGIQGGIVGYASSAEVSGCYFSKNTASDRSNIPAFQGGVCGKAFSSRISSCTVEDVNLYSKSSFAVCVGGICGWMDASSALLDNTALQVKLTRDVGTGFTLGGVAGSVEGASSEISGNTFGGKYSIDYGGSWTSFVQSNVCAGASFTVNKENTLVESAFDLSGVVVCGADPLEGVVVTDGYQSVKTDANGRFHLTSLPSKVRFVSVCLPEGYGAPVSKGLPQFFVRTGGEAKDDIVFNLRKLSNPDRYTVFVTADPQQRSSGAMWDCFAYASGTLASNLYQSVGTRASAISGREVYGIVLGDVVHETMSLYSTYTGYLSKWCSSMSTYHIIGNHDFNTSASEMVSGAATFEKTFGPVNYSMNIGKLHFVMLDDIQMKLNSSGQLKDYDTGLTDDQIAWLESDLQYVPASTPIVVCAHSPLFYRHSGGNKSVSSTVKYAVNGDAYKALFSKYATVYALGGHMHHNFTYICAKETSDADLKGVQCLQLARCTGALWLNDYLNTDGSPRGYLQMEVDGESVSWKYICDVRQSASFIGKYGSYFSYSAPSYDDRDWNYLSGVPTLKSDGSAVDENYQMKLYAGEGGKLYANIFFWDALWGTPVMSYKNSSGTPVNVNMSRIALSAGPGDFAWQRMNAHYSTGNKYWKDASDGTSYSAHMFSCAMPSDCPSSSATVTVTDRFGNVYASTVSW